MAAHEGRVVIVTGGGRGLGRAHCLAIAAGGAAVVVNDTGGDAAGVGVDPAVAAAVVEEIRERGGTAVASAHDAADDAQAAVLVEETLARFGRVNAVVNSAGIVRDAMFVTMSAESWDAAIRGCLRTHFAVSSRLARYWREQAKAGADLRPRIVNTTSGAGLFGSIGQSNYAAAKAAVSALTLVQAAELRRYGVLVNAIAPIARTRLTEGVFAEQMATQGEAFDRMDPANVAPAVAWLAGSDNEDVTGRVFEVEGATITVCMNWHRGPSAAAAARPSAAEAGAAIRRLTCEAPELVGVYG